MSEIGWNEQRGCFVDAGKYEDAIRSIFKLYPWESMMEEAVCGAVFAHVQGDAVD